jgi:hypothetical protein
MDRQRVASEENLQVRYLLILTGQQSCLVVFVRWSVSSQNRIFVLFYEDDMLPFLLRSLNIL